MLRWLVVSGCLVGCAHGAGASGDDVGDAQAAREDTSPSPPPTPPTTPIPSAIRGSHRHGPPHDEQRYGFWDPGLVKAIARTAYASEGFGTSSDPMHPTACLYPDASDSMLINPEACGNVSKLPPFASANAWTNATAWPTDAFWVLQMNDEGAFDACNSGAPDVSLPRSKPGEGIMGFTLLEDGEPFFRAHLVLNYTFQGPCDAVTPFSRIPFLSFGAHKNRGNGIPVGAINPSLGVPSHVVFTLRLWDISSNATPMSSELWTVASWGGKTRMVFIALGHANLTWGIAHRHWNWPIAQSFLAPGADIVFFDHEDLGNRCPGALTATARGQAVSTGLFSTDDRTSNVGKDILYDLDLDALYHCASGFGPFDDPLPSTQDIAVDGVFWSNEIGGRGSPSYLWTSVHGIDVQ